MGLLSPGRVSREISNFLIIPVHSLGRSFFWLGVFLEYGVSKRFRVAFQYYLISSGVFFYLTDLFFIHLHFFTPIWNGPSS